MKDVIIIGSGPAGVSAALYTVRAGFETLIISKDFGSLEKAERIENYYGLSQPLSGVELAKAGVKQAQSLGVELVNEEVVGIGWEDGFTVSTTQNVYTSGSVIIATGSSRTVPKIEGLQSFEGRGISYCAVCDAFFYRNKNVAVLGSGDYALHEAAELKGIVGSVTLLTNGAEPYTKFPDEVSINTKKIVKFGGDDKLSSVVFADGSELSVDGIFIAYGVAGSADLAKKIGAITENNKVIVDNNMATNIPGLFAAGDCTGGMLQVAKAVYEGAMAGAQSIKYIRELKKK
ncbi:MAG: NAD(P)/FAD-dependent oxidoreductase [Clostridiales bacterium]|jgi:thioredoxin reductase (NADPH)|nr:NAD(P)/FAD-dependent oxidoreductase [Clostridiales bacterium]